MATTRTKGPTTTPVKDPAPVDAPPAADVAVDQPAVAVDVTIEAPPGEDPRP